MADEIKELIGAVKENTTALKSVLETNKNLLETNKKNGDDFAELREEIKKGSKKGSTTSFGGGGWYSRDINSILDNKSLTQKEKLVELDKESSEEQKKINKEITEYEKKLKETNLSEEDRIKYNKELLRLKGEQIKKEEQYQKARREVNQQSWNAIDKVIQGVKIVDQEFMRILGPWSKIDAASSKFAKNIGLAAEGMRKMRKETIDAVSNGKIGINYNMSADELIATQQNYVKAVGRNLRIGFQDQESLAAISSVFGDNGANELMAGFERFGVSLTDVGDHLGKLYSDASKNGVSLEAYAKNVQTGLAMAQTYTFKGGLKSMEEMAKRAAAIHMDMKQVEALANKTNTVEGAIQTSARLQVLGGNFAALSDPLSMLNESLNDMEGLGKRIEQMTKNMGHFNRATGEVSISGFDRQRLRAVAEATGMDYNNLIQQTQQQAKRGEIQAQIRTSKANGLSDEFKELLANTATFKDGKAGVSIGGEWKTLDNLDNKDYKKLLEETQSESADIKDIAKNVRSLVDIRSGAKKQVENTQARWTNGLGQVTKTVTSWLGGTGLFAAGGALISIAVSVSRIAAYVTGGIGGGIRNIRQLFGRGSTFSTGRGFRMPKGVNRMLHPVRSIKALNRFKKIRNLQNVARGARVLPKGVDRILHPARTVKALNRFKKIRNLQNVARGANAVRSVGNLSRFAGPAAGAIAAITTGIDEFTGKKRYGTGKKIGRTAGSGLGAWGGAAAGAAIGSVVPVVGTLIGGAIGAIAGSSLGKWIGGGFANQKRRERWRGKLGISDDELKGDYSVKKLKEISMAKATGKVSKKTLNTLAKKGDMEMYKQLYDLRQSKKEERKNKRRERRLEARKTRFNNATFEVGVAHFNGVGSGNSGGILSTAFNSVVKVLGGKKEDGKNEATISAFERQKALAQKRNQANTGSYGPIDININGTLKLESSNGQSVDLMSVIRDNPRFKTELAELINKEIQKLNNNGYNTNTPFYSPRGVRT